MAIYAEPVRADLRVTLELRAKPLGDAQGGLILWIDAADHRAQTDLAVGVVAGAPRRLRGEPVTMVIRSKPPHDLRLRPPFRVPKTTIAGEAASDFFLNDPTAVATKLPVSHLCGHSTPGAGTVA